MKCLAFTASVLAAALVVPPAPVHAVEPDYARYERLLAAHVGRVTIANRAGRDSLYAAFDYLGFRTAPGAMSVMATLGAIRADLLAVPPERMTGAERKAWAINLYNFLVLEAVLGQLRLGPLRSVMDVPGFFDVERVEIAGARYSLNAFERRFLFGDFDRKGGAPPPDGLDPRAHFAIVCAARGCPPLWWRAYRAAGLDAALDDVTARTLRGRAGVDRDSRGRYRLSQIFEWYEADFGGRAGVIAFLKRHGPAALRRAFGSWGPEAVAGFIPWDWRLNQPGGDGVETPAPR